MRFSATGRSRRSAETSAENVRKTSAALVADRTRPTGAESVSRDNEHQDGEAGRAPEVSPNRRQQTTVASISNP
jgi:hypothetical protein